MQDVDICIAGAGIIGLSLALELERRGARVTVLEQGRPLSEASTAAAGMLASGDPENPPQLRPLADLSLRLYPEFLERLSGLSGTAIPFHTSTTLQALPAHVADASPLSTEELRTILPELVPGARRFVRLDEHSLDPRQLAVALYGSVRAKAIDLRTRTRVVSAHAVDGAVEIHTSSGSLRAGQFVDCTGAWATRSFTLTRLDASLGVVPRKGQILSVALPPELELRTVVRTPEIYIVPRTTDATVGRAVIGATIEDAGYDKTVYQADIARLQRLAAELLPQIASARVAERWAGLRPATEDGLPLLGGVPGEPNCFLAAGHYRNGILLAPATARVMAQVLSGESASVDLGSFSPSRVFEAAG